MEPLILFPIRYLRIHILYYLISHIDERSTPRHIRKVQRSLRGDIYDVIPSDVNRLGIVINTNTLRRQVVKVPINIYRFNPVMHYAQT